MCTLCDMEKVRCGTCEVGLFNHLSTGLPYFTLGHRQYFELCCLTVRFDPHFSNCWSLKYWWTTREQFVLFVKGTKATNQQGHVTNKKQKQTKSNHCDETSFWWKGVYTWHTCQYWNGNVVILSNSSSETASEDVKMTTSGAARISL